MTHDHQHQRAAHADPESPTALLRSLSSRSRVEGDGVWLEALADRETWNRQPPEAQDAAVQVVAGRLGSEWESLWMRVWSCPNPIADYCEDCGGSGDDDGPKHLRGRPGHKAIDCAACAGTGRAISHRLGLFRHRPTGMEFSLIPGRRPYSVCPECNGRGHTCPGGSPCEGCCDSCDGRRELSDGIAPLLVGRWPVTLGQIREIPQTRWTHEESLPCVGMSHEDALSTLTELYGLRLPSSAEWEHACRAGSVTRFFWGDEMDHSFVWHAGNSGECWDCDGSDLPIPDDCSACRNNGSLRPHAPSEHDAAGRHNAFGLVDMVGNVWEWTSEHGIAGGSHRYMPPESYGLILRSGQFIHDEIGDVGFRAVCSIPGLEARS